MPEARALIALVIGAFATACVGPPLEHRGSGDELLQRAERSFSDVPFGTRKPPSHLTLINDGGCIAGGGECSYADAQRVVHYFSDGELVVKSLDVAQVGSAPIAALGIGDARELDQVVSRVGRFLPGAKVRCDKSGSSQEASTMCGATLGQGWIKLVFDNSRHLIEARIDAYQFT